MVGPERQLSDFTISPLTPDAWDAFAAVLERHNGVFGGCWRAGLSYARPKGTKNCVMRTTVPPAR